MRTLQLVVLAAAAVAVPAFAQTAAPAPAAAPAAKAPAAAPAVVKTPAGGTVKAVQPGLFEVAGPRVNEVMGAGIQKITAATGQGIRSIRVQSPWGDSYFGWPKNIKPVAFTITMGTPAGGATISAPGFKNENAADYKAAIDAVAKKAIAQTNDNKNWMTSGGQ
jgi:hypothetical protein